jgi:hypothetical protein
MRWNATDTPAARLAGRDVAFWLHLLAAPPARAIRIFTVLGVTGGHADL